MMIMVGVIIWWKWFDVGKVVFVLVRVIRLLIVRVRGWDCFIFWMIE